MISQVWVKVRVRDRVRIGESIRKVNILILQDIPNFLTELDFSILVQGQGHVRSKLVLRNH